MMQAFFRQLRFCFLTVFVALTVLTAFPRPAAACCLCVNVAANDFNQWFGGPMSTVYRINNHVTSEFTGLRNYIVSLIWEDNILPAMMMMADQLTAVAMQQVFIIGTFMDAKFQMETQQVFQKAAARAHKDYHPSIGMCEFGSSAKSLAASERKGEFNTVLLSQRAQDRHLGNAFNAAATGPSGDIAGRIKQFREKFCDPSDNNNGLSYMCDHDQVYGSGAVGATTRQRMNKDVDYARTLDSPWTLDVDFTNTTLTANEEEVLALGSNLYGHEVFLRPPAASIRGNSATEITNMQRFYLDARSVLAKRSVAENSYNAIVGLKSAGSMGSRDYLRALLAELGVPNGGATPETLQLLGNNPSYYAQMEILTKKIYQNPDFYTNLYDKPANVDRKGVALQAIGLMQKFDLFKSYLRQEASLSILLELAVIELQEEAENEMGSGSSTVNRPSP